MLDQLYVAFAAIRGGNSMPRCDSCTRLPLQECSMCSATHSSTAVGLLLWCQVPAPFNLEAVMKSKQDDPSALHVVLFQEVCA
jgi:hypothetical protein